MTQSFHLDVKKKKELTLNLELIDIQRLGESFLKTSKGNNNKTTISEQNKTLECE